MERKSFPVKEQNVSQGLPTWSKGYDQGLNPKSRTMSGTMIWFVVATQNAGGAVSMIPAPTKLSMGQQITCTNCGRTFRQQRSTEAPAEFVVRPACAEDIDLASAALLKYAAGKEQQEGSGHVDGPAAASTAEADPDDSEPDESKGDVVVPATLKLR